MKRVKSKICLFLTIALIFSVFSVFNFHTLKAESTAKAELLKLDLTKQDGMNLEYVVQVTQPVEADALTISNINLIYKDEQDHFISVSLSLMMNVPGNQLEDKGNGVYRVKTSSLQYGETTGTYTLNSVKLVLSNNTTVVDYKSSWEHTIAVTKNPLSAPVITSVNMEGNKIGAIALPYEKDIHFTVENAEQYDKVTYSLNYKSKNNNHDTFISQDKYNPTNTFYFDELIRFSDNEWSLKSIEVRAANYEQNAFKTTIYTNDNNDDNSDIEIKPLSDLPFNPSIFDFTVTNYLSDKEPPVLNSFKVLTTDVTLPAKAKISIDMSDNSGTMNYQPMMQAKVTRNGETKVESVSFVSNKRVEGTNEIVGYVQIGNGGRYSGLEKAEIIEVTLNDTAGNRVTYTSDQTKIDEYAKNPNPNNPIKSMPKVDPISFKELYKFDKKLNVDSGEYINIVKNMQEGSYVLLDISNKQIIDKDFFDAIKGKNITVVFQTFNSMALQWVVNGKDINEQTKDIDMSIKQIAVNDKVKEGEDSTLDLFNMNKGKTQEEKNNTTLKYIKMEYYKEYLKQFDIKTANYADEFIKEYLKHNRYKLVFAENGTLPGKMRIRVSSEDVNSQIPSDEISDNMSVY
ncbi:MAG: hypothetical protein EOM11_06330, partial [Erysipelotrichia bacterium]|nr:hypothetical protein [Erysipelotrichia bacterium]